MFWKDRGGFKPRTRVATSLPVSTKPIETQLVTRVPVLRTSLGPDTAVSGRLSFTVPTRIEGRLRGEVRASDLLVVGEDAVVEGIVRAQRLVVLGEVRGDIRGADLVEIGPGGRLMGTVETHSLVVKKGGCLDGDCRIAPARKPLRVVHPVPATST